MNLMGQSKFLTKLEGEAIDEDRCRKRAVQESNKFLTAILDVTKQILNSFFGAYGAASESALKRGDDSLRKAMPGSSYIALDTFHRCLSLLAMARKIKEDDTHAVVAGSIAVSKYIKAAKKPLSRIKKWAEQGNPNVRHYESLLDAEFAAYQGRSNVAKKHYETAAIFADRGAFLHDSALINERYGKYLIYLAQQHEKRRRDNVTLPNDAVGTAVATERRNARAARDEAKFRLLEAIKYYQEWGAYVKADCLEREYGTFLSPTPSQIEVYHHRHHSENTGTDQV